MHLLMRVIYNITYFLLYALHNQKQFYEQPVHYMYVEIVYLNKIHIIQIINECSYYAVYTIATFL